jgi:hypothetical protein
MLSTMSAKFLLPGDGVVVEEHRLTVEEVRNEKGLVLLHFRDWDYSLIISEELPVPVDASVSIDGRDFAVVAEAVCPRLPTSRLTQDLASLLT